MWPTFPLSFLIQFPCGWLLRKLRPQTENSLEPWDAYLMLANRIQPGVLAPRWHQRVNSCSWLTAGFRRSTKCIVVKKAGSELSAPWHTRLLTSAGRAETGLIFTALHTMNHVIRVFNWFRDYASMAIAGEHDAFWCPLQTEIINRSTSWYTTPQGGACTGTEHEGDHSFKAAALRSVTPTEAALWTQAWRVCGDCQGWVLGITAAQSFKCQCLLHSNETTSARGPSSAHQTSSAAEQTSASLRSSPKAACLLCTNQPLQVIKLCFCICSTAAPTQQSETKWIKGVKVSDLFQMEHGTTLNSH